MKPDLILLHAPSVYDFREKSIMFGPMSDLVPSTPIFEMYPIGFLTIANYLAKRDLSVRIVNLAYRMYEDPDFNVEKFIKNLDTFAFGIDLHWLAHCQGSTEVAKILKKYHPETPVIFGGFSSSYFYKELIEFPQVDYIIRGDSTEEPLYRLIKTIKNKDLASLKSIPNLVWKNGSEGNKTVFYNSISCISADLEEIDFDYRIMFKEVFRFKDLKSLVPFCDWFRYPITTIPVVRGCYKNCANCGGSKYAFKIFADRIKPAFRSPKKLVDEIKNIRKYINSPIFLLGDINSNGEDYVREFFKYIKELGKDLQIFFEFFEPPAHWFFDEAGKIFSSVCYEISPDSHDEKIRKIMGKNYTNDALMDSIEYALLKGAKRYDLYFMTGVPHQTKASIMGTVQFCQEIYQRLNWDKRFMPFISPMAPFLDPGSRIFENPGKFGFKLLRKTLKEHVEAITKPSWKYILNYESDFISKDDLVYSTYDAALGLNRLKGQAGSISRKVMAGNENRTIEAVKIMKQIDGIMAIDDENTRDEKLMELKDKTYNYSLSTVCEKKELEFPLSNKSFRWFEIFKASFNTK
jgi:B12-binding domain/radical SAM domain protein